MRRALERHWPEYLIEAALLGLFMVSACAFGTLLEHPASPLLAAWPQAASRRALMGFLMGATAVALIHSPWGRRSGAHMNPAVTLAFLRLGKVEPADAAFYVLAQVVGGVLGVALSAALYGRFLADPAVHYVATVPGPLGPWPALAAEAAISFVLMSAVLLVSNRPAIAGYTGLVAGLLVAAFITFEAPISGMSMNPARTLGSAAPAMDYRALWVYLTAPPLGMLAAAEAYARLAGKGSVLCAKLGHDHRHRCIFRCRFPGCG